MRHFLPSARRIRNIIGATVVGVVAAGAFATPALACHGEFVEVKTECGNEAGTVAKVTWKIKVVGTTKKVTIKDVTWNAGTMTGNLKDSNGKEVDNGTILTGIQVINVSDGPAVLNATIDFPNEPDSKDWHAKDAKNADGSAANVKPLTDINMERCTPEEKKYGASMKSNCDSVEITLRNGSDNPAKFEVTGVEGQIEVAKKSTKVVKIPGSKITTGKIVVQRVRHNGSKVNIDTFNWAPEVCDTATPTPTATSGGSLPVTGTNVTIISVVALLLVGAGAGLFLVARRRQVKFTA